MAAQTRTMIVVRNTTSEDILRVPKELQQKCYMSVIQGEPVSD